MMRALAAIAFYVSRQQRARDTATSHWC